MATSKADQADALQAAYRKHERRWNDNRYVYPVVSRRSGGISIGINLNPGKECSFDCIYCQVDRRHRDAAGPVDLHRVRVELDGILNDEKSGLLYGIHPFSLLPGEKRGIRDIAFSGDGEPTASGGVFHSSMEIAAQLRSQYKLLNAKIVLITNGTFLDDPAVKEALAVMDRNNGEIWAKIDAGTEEYFKKINRTAVAFEKILGNILQTALVRPVVIQSLWMRVDDQAPPSCEIAAFCGRLNRLCDSGAQLKALHLHTIARRPAEDFVSPLSDEELDDIAGFLHSHVSVPVEVFYAKGCREETEIQREDAKAQ
jgi:wyosine [tRNA(Phe)-imidazoG37] synthetase (radical SAM superfamily)